MKIKKKQIIILFVAAVLTLIMIGIAHSNTDLELYKYYVASGDIPSAFDNFRIVQISDLHNTKFGENNRALITLLKQTDADIIVITGDMIDSRKTNVGVAVSFAKEAVKLAPTYYVNGNHESRIPEEYKKLKQGLADAGVTILENSSKDITIGDDSITLIGINDPTFRMELVDDTMEQNITHQLTRVIPDNDNYKVLLAHRPEYFDVYAGKVDLVLSGHAHGGQFRIPLIGGVIAPGQGFFPEDYEGAHRKNNTEMIVSRGIGNSIFPFRINNKPEIVIAELTKIADE